MSENKTIEAPWTDEQVQSLNAYQISGVMHPFTCGNHKGYSPSLVAKNRGWQCPECSYVQNWCWQWMADWSWNRETMGIYVDDPPNTFKISEVFMFISKDEQGNEGICAFNSPEGMMPMVAADKDRLESLRPIAQQIAKLTNKAIHLIKITSREDLEVIR